jgi:hypothetical protein
MKERIGRGERRTGLEEKNEGKDRKRRKENWFRGEE